MIENSMANDALWDDEQGLAPRRQYNEYTTAAKYLADDMSNVMVEALEFTRTPMTPESISEIDDAARELLEKYPNTKMARLIRHCAELMEERAREI